VHIAELYQLFLRSSGVSTDTRSIEVNQVFFALRGDNFDGNKFAHQALASGAIAAVVDDPAVAMVEGLIRVHDSLESLQQLARHHRRQMKAQVIAITGSNGKTTSKELVSAVLGTAYKVVSTRGNLNNHIGVPLTLLRLKREDEFAVIEMGANHRGEIAQLCAVAEPDYGVVTNVGKAHLEGFGGLQGVIAAKSELYYYLAEHDGLVFINPELEHLEKMAENVSRRVTYGAQADVCGLILSEDPNLKLEIAWKDGVMEVDSQLVGRYNFNNILLAAAAGLHFGVPPEKVRAGIEAYVPSSNRSQVMRIGSNTIILDAYNANPSSMDAALNNLHTMAAGKKVAVLGEMLELGSHAEEEHRLVAAKAMEVADVVALVGEKFRESFGQHLQPPGVREGSQVLHFSDATSCREWFAQQQFADAVILIKGSRKVGLETILPEKTR
jgi:UDP-N-acetylmuramoyl-tripeptide--D-alanyl-D-alanine ligase